MIVKCKFCEGTGLFPQQSFTPVFGELQKPCPTCKGAGELVLPGPADNYVVCKVCKGAGSIKDPLVLFSGNISVCSACKGAGSVSRAVIQSEEDSSSKIIVSTLPRPTSFDFDLALSFAGEDRSTVEEYSQLLKEKGVRVFLDTDQQADLWGADLYVKLDEIYRMKAMFCIMFISKNYAAKRWTNHERQSAQARAFKENREYILPVRLDDTEIPGLRETVGYVDLRKTSIQDLVKLTLEKIEKAKKDIFSSNSGYAF